MQCIFKDSQLCECEVYIQFWRLFLHPLLGSDEMDVGHTTFHCLYQYTVSYHNRRIANRLVISHHIWVGLNMLTVIVACLQMRSMLWATTVCVHTTNSCVTMTWVPNDGAEIDCRLYNGSNYHLRRRWVLTFCDISL